MEMKQIILIDEKVTMHQGITNDEGIVIYEEILSKLKEGKEVVLDFQGITMMTTAFLNVVIGQLYKDYTSEELKEKLHFENIPSGNARRIKNVTDNAKLFYKDPDSFTKNIEENIYG